MLEKYAKYCLRVCTSRTQRFACLYDTEAGCVCVSYKPLNNGNNQLKIVCVYFVHGNVLLTWVSDTRACTLPLVSDTRACTLPLVSDTRACVVRSPPNISSKTCHRTLWAALRLHRRMLPGGGIFCKKIQKVMLKIYCCQGKYGMIRLYH